MPYTIYDKQTGEEIRLWPGTDTQSLPPSPQTTPPPPTQAPSPELEKPKFELAQSKLFEDLKLGKTQLALVKLLANAGDMSRDQLALKLGTKPDIVRKALKRLSDRNIVVVGVEPSTFRLAANIYIPGSDGF